MRAGGRQRQRNAEAAKARAHRRHQAADRSAVDTDLDRLHVGRDTARPLRRLERQRIAPGIQGERLGEAAGTLDERGLDAVRCRCGIPDTTVGLDAAAGSEDPADAWRAWVVLIATAESRDLEARI